MASEKTSNYTRDEILSQPDIWSETLKDWQDLDLNSFPKASDYDQALYIGCGSTYFLSRWAARMNEALTGTISRAVPSSDILFHPESWLSKNRRTLLVASSRSAATTETIRAINQFKAEYEGDVIVVTCNPENPMGSQTEHVVSAVRAQEKSIAQTRSFSSMVLGNALLIARNISTEIPSKLKASGQNLIDRNFEKMSAIAEDQTIQRFFVLGSGGLYGLANEAMLKLKEVSLSYAESFQPMEFRHGPMSMVDSHSLVIGLLGDDGREQELAVLRDMQALGARTLVIAEEKPKNLDGLDDWIVLGSELPLLWRSVLYLPVLQWLAYARGLAKGLNPDRPHNLDAVVVLDN